MSKLNVLYAHKYVPTIDKIIITALVAPTNYLKDKVAFTKYFYRQHVHVL